MYVYNDEDNAPMNESAVYQTCKDVCAFKNICMAKPHPFKIHFECDNFDYFMDKMADVISEEEG